MNIEITNIEEQSDGAPLCVKLILQQIVCFFCICITFQKCFECGEE